MYTAAAAAAAFISRRVVAHQAHRRASTPTASSPSPRIGLQTAKQAGAAGCRPKAHHEIPLTSLLLLAARLPANSTPILASPNTMGLE